MCSGQDCQKIAKNFIRNCDPCLLESKQPAKVPLQSWPKPDGPWQRLHIDFAGPVDGTYYLIVVDAMSKYPEVVELKTIIASRTVAELRRMFARFGAPSV